MGNVKIITLGRSKNNDCVFQNNTVSGNHAVITLNSDGVSGVIKDLNSTNGTYINNGTHKITVPTNISYNDIIRLGSEVTSLKEIIEKANKTKVSGVGTNHFSNFHGIQHKSIGKNPNNDIVLSYNDVSRKHAVIYFNNQGQVVVEDLGSTNGTFVNGIKITSKILQPGDRLTITRNYPVSWENLFMTSHKSVRKQKSIIMYGLGAVVAVAVIGFIIYMFMPWSKEKIYKEYNSSVALVTSCFGYKVYIDDRDFTQFMCQCMGLQQNEFISVKDGKPCSGMLMSQGTAFFVSGDGKLATNLHVARPWLYSNDKEILKQQVDRIITYIAATSNPFLNRSNVEIKGVMGKIYVLPNGLPMTEGNLIECVEFKGHNDTDKDVAIIQTCSHELPSKVKKIVDLNKADTSEEALTEGTTIYTIGFPYGSDIAINSNNEMVNQVHEGSVTQNRGDFEFGHDAATASGASGSPIFNEKGKLVGIHHAGLTGVTGAQGFNMGIKAKYIIELLK